MEEKGTGFTNNIIKVIILYYADDGLLVAENIEDANKNLRMMKERNEMCGLSINKNKSNVIIWNMKEQPEEVEGIIKSDG